MWGTRGSLPSPGPQTVVHGGNTSCVEVRGADGSCVVLDAGSGIRLLGASAEARTTRFDLLITHLHTDHIQGLGFFNPLYWPEAEIRIWGPPSITLPLRTRLTRYFSPPFFPAQVRDLPCRLTFHDMPRGSFQIGDLRIDADFICHPGPTVGYRITEDGVSMAYMPDHEPALGVERFPGQSDWTSGYDLASGANLLIHDAQYNDAEYAACVGWGHSSIHHAVAFAAAAHVERLVTFHHDPAHDDEAVARLIQEVDARMPQLPFELIPGTEGSSFDV